MKFNFIKQYQQGGVYTPTYVVYDPLPFASEATGARAAAPTKEESSSEKGVVDKDLLLMIKEAADGLPSDVEPILNQLSTMYSRLALAEYLPGGGNKRNTAKIAAQYLQILGQLKTAKFNKQEYDRAYEQVSKNGGINEVAITTRGQLVCFNSAENNFKLLTPEELKKSSGYTPLTNSELLRYRANDVSLAGNTEVLSVVQNGIGIQQVTAMIQEVLNHIGTSEEQEAGYFGASPQEVITGVKAFKEAIQKTTASSGGNTVQDLYKYKIVTKDQANQMNAAMQYIYMSLPETAKTLLKSRADLTDTGAIQMIEKLMASQLKSTSTFDITLEGGPTKSGSDGKADKAASKDSTSLKASQLVNMMESLGGVQQHILIDRGDGIQMSLWGKHYNIIENAKDDKPITDTSMIDLLTQSGLKGLIKNKSSMTFGDQRIDDQTLHYITYNNTGATRANLPIKEDGTVNLQLLDEYSKAEKEINELGDNITAEQVRDIYVAHGLNELLKADGTLNERKFGAFIAIEGYTTDLMSGLVPSEFVKEYTGDKNKAFNLIEQSLTTKIGDKAIKPDIDRRNLWNPADWFPGTYDTILKGVLYIPIDNNQLNAAMYNNQNLDFDEARELERKYQDFDKNLSLNSTGIDNLNLKN